MATRDGLYQPGVISNISRTALFLILQVKQADTAKAVARILSSIPERTRRLARLVPKSKLESTVGVGAHYWNLLGKPQRPAWLHDFPEIRGPQLSAPSTGGDLFLHIKSDREDLNFELGNHSLVICVD